MKNMKVIIVDDEPIIRAGLENWLSQNYVIRSFNSASGFLEAFNLFEFEDGIPTCILLDFQMPGMNGVELQTSLKAMNAEFPIIFMSGNAQQSDIIDAWHGGAVDFILKPFTPSQITDALSKQFLQIKERLTLEQDSHSNAHINISITKREAEVLLLLGEGRLQNEVAEILGISIHTVKMYRAFLKDKLGLKTLAELGRYYTQYKQSIELIANGIQSNLSCK